MRWQSILGPCAARWLAATPFDGGRARDCRRTQETLYDDTQDTIMLLAVDGRAVVDRKSDADRCDTRAGSESGTGSNPHTETEPAGDRKFRTDSRCGERLGAAALDDRNAAGID